MYVTDALIAFVANQKDKPKKTNAALSKKLHVVGFAFALTDTDDLSCRSIYDELLFYGVAFMFA